MTASGRAAAAARPLADLANASSTIAAIRGASRHILGVAFWAAPTMTIGRCTFATCYTLYILVALAFEEHDLLAQHGAAYADHRRRVPKLLPVRRSRASSA